MRLDVGLIRPGLIGGATMAAAMAVGLDVRLVRLDLIGGATMASAMTVGLDVRLVRLHLIGGATMPSAMTVSLDVGLGALRVVFGVETVAVRLDVGLIAIVAGVAVCLAVRLVLGHRILLLVGRANLTT
jgi:hypothetical protein